MIGQRILTIGERITVRLVYLQFRLDLTKGESMLFFVCGEVVHSQLVKLETSCTVILPPTVSVLWTAPLHKLYRP